MQQVALLVVILHLKQLGGSASGFSSQATTGGAAGYDSQTIDGGAIGNNAATSDGFAGGKNARCESGGLIDAVQLGTGTNTSVNTFQVYNYEMLDASGNIPAARLVNSSGGQTIRFIQKRPINV